MDVDAAVRFAGDRGAHHVHDAERARALALRFAHRRQRVGGLADCEITSTVVPSRTIGLR